MPDANINDRSSVEQIYPRDDFDRDAGENSDAKATVHRGLRIVSAVDPDGRFKAERGLRHVGESDPESDTVFVAPFLAQSHAPLQQTNTYGGAVETSDPAQTLQEKADDYQAFIDRIIAAAKAAEFKPPIGRHEGRLRGFHGG
jgi:hypothetical protein